MLGVTPLVELHSGTLSQALFEAMQIAPSKLQTVVPQAHGYEELGWWPLVSSHTAGAVQVVPSRHAERKFALVAPAVHGQPAHTRGPP